MNKKFSVFLTALFCGFLAVILAGSLILPDREFSELENRNLQQLPQFTLAGLQSGKFMDTAEDYVDDQIIGRDFWVALKAWSERISGKQENNGVYFAAKDTLIKRLDTPGGDVLEKNADYVNQLADNLDVPVFFGLIPSAACIWADRLPEGAPSADETAIIRTVYGAVQADTVDLLGTLSAHSSEDLYYRTDHHWTSLGAYYGYTALMDAFGMEAAPLDEGQKTTASDEFYGTLFSSSGVRWVPPDAIDRYISEDGVTVTSYPNGSPVEGSLYVDSYLSEKDKYSFFLGGNMPLNVIRTEHTDAPKLLLIRDSYADSLAPFLTQNFSEIHLFDPRMNLSSIKDYVTENDIDLVAALYSISNFVSDGSNLFVLGR